MNDELVESLKSSEKNLLASIQLEVTKRTCAYFLGPSSVSPIIVKILSLYIILLCTHIFSFIACYIICDGIFNRH